MSHRIQLHRTKGWRLPPGAINVARPSRWGNPFRTAAAFREWLATGECCCRDVTPWGESFDIRDRRKWILDHLEDLRRYNLFACWCGPLVPPGECHADVYLELLR